MESALIVSCTEKSTAFLADMLNASFCGSIVVLQSCAEARHLLSEQNFDLVIINAPLRDESGESLARQIGAKGSSQVILIVKNEYLDAVSAATEEDGIFTIAKPISGTVFRSALSLAKAAQKRMKRLQEENSKLTQKIEDIHIIDRAKCILVSFLNIREQEAHRYIEKQAMDLRTTRRTIAERILKMYEE